MRHRRLIINVDSDNTVYWWVPLMAKLVSDYTGQPATPTPSSYSCWLEWGITELEFRDIMEENATFLLTAGQPVLGSVSALEEILDDGHRVRIVSDKIARTSGASFDAQAATVAWYAAQDLLHRVEMVFTDRKREFSADIVIDDKPDMKWAQHDAVNLLFNQSWNQEVSSDALPYARVHDWDDIKDWVNRAAVAPTVRGT